MKIVCLISSLVLTTLFSHVYSQGKVDARIYELDKYDYLLKTDATLAVNNNGSNIDIKYHRFNLTMNPDVSPATISGSVTTYFVTKVANVNTIKFDLYNNGMDGDSFRYHGSSYTLTEAVHHIVDTLTINLPVTIAAAGTLDSVTVFYHGTPPQSANSRGYKRTTISSSNILSTHSSGYFARQWWPCKHTLGDKIDSVDIVVTSPSAYVVAATGMVQNANPTTVSGNKTWFYKMRNPVAHYLIAIAVHPYTVYNSPPANISGTMVPIRNYLTSGTNTATVRGVCDAMKGAMEYFSSIYGDYPFKNERYGHVVYTFGGGMENQTSTFVGASAVSDASIMAHELAHQWFGDNVTCNSWGNIWVNEGFARYSEVLYAEHLAGNTSGGNTKRASYKTNAQSATGTVYRYDTEVVTEADHTGKIFNSAMVYDKASIVISMLRKLVGDANFFQALKNYQAIDSLRYGYSSTEDVKHHFEYISGMDLDSFFDDFIYKSGYPTYTVRYDPSATAPYKVAFTLTQAKSAGSTVNYYNTVLPLRFRNTTSGKDTMIYVADDPSNAGVVLQYTLSFPVNSVTIDPYSEAYTYGGTVVLSPVTLLPVSLKSFSAEKIENHGRIQWNCETGTRFSHFEIEKSTDGINYIKIDEQLPAEGITQYTTSDYKLRQGKNYYRLKMVEMDASFSYSQVAFIDFTGNLKMQFGPNPAATNFYIFLPGVEFFEYKIRLINQAGQVFLPNVVSTVTGKVELNVSDVPNGLYWLEMKHRSGTKKLERLLIKH
ncbi:M1 family aminopeptidase [Pollutibacter soli]|uniref:M1 family aminopeptidase n=1 Tax=Pollutibacter soli TaxID=3034157 RepID=UPI003013CB11